MKRLFIIRHIRWFYHSYRIQRWLHYCQQNGLGLFIQDSDYEHLQKIWEGKA